MPKLPLFSADANPQIDAPLCFKDRSELEGKVARRHAMRIPGPAYQLVPLTPRAVNARLRFMGASDEYRRAVERDPALEMTDVWTVKPSGRVSVWQMNR